MLLPPPTSTLFPYTTLFRSYPDQDGADRGNRQERGRDPCRDRDEDDRRADDDPGQIRERTTHTVDRARGDEADRRRARAAHDRQRDEQERSNRSPANRREQKRLKHRRNYPLTHVPDSRRSRRRQS